MGNTKEINVESRRSVISRLHTLELIFLNFSEPLMLISKDMNILIANQAAKSAFGFTDQDMKNLGLTTLYETSLLDAKLQTHINRCLEGNISFCQTKTIENGQERCWEIRLDPVREENDTNACLLVCRDNTESEQMQERLKKYQLTISNTSEMIVLLDKNLCCTIVNDTFQEKARRKNSKIIGLPFQTVMKDFIDEVLITEALQECMLGRSMRFQHWVKFTSKRLSYIDFHFDPVYGITGSVDGVVVSAREITNIWKAEEKYKQVIDASEDGFWEYNIRKNKLFSSKKSYTMLEYMTSDFSGKKETLLKTVHSDDLDKFKKDYLTFIHSRKSNFKTEFRAITKNGNIKNILVRGKALNRTQSGFPQRMIGVQTDITAIKESERALKEAKEIAEKANKTKSEFLANMSHEIRTPLNSVIGYTELLESTPINAVQSDYLGSIRAAGKNLLHLINDILDLSKIEAGMMELKPEPCNIMDLVGEIRKIFALKCQDKGIKFKVSIPEDLPEMLFFDGIRMRQVLLNLIGNAIKFTSEGSVSLNISFARCINDPDKISLTLSVRDTGIGIPFTEQKGIFEAFRQQSGQSTRKYGGTGLGLSISKRLVEMMNGDIDLVSELGNGAEFKVTIPSVSVFGSKKEPDPDLSKKVVSQELPLIISEIKNSRIFSENDKAKIPELLKAYDIRCVKAWEIASETELSDDILHFARLVIELGNRYKLENLIKYGNLLIRYTETFDLDKMSLYLSAFSELAESSDDKD
ncbi:hypothetical protein FUAX_20810 [Fulvitalea axinellae]|uniref:histidine kinase n=1 Tax=Fulvitalea axinellae TaxID=1182444 RepID=A0AAU9D5B1_9BACT|nr:hypothetical protein FUAX_20810 [Fulvitalea axinellae]